MTHDIATTADDPVAADPMPPAPAPAPPDGTSPVRPVARSTAILAVHAGRAAASLHTVEFDPVSRWYRRLHTADDHEVWLLSWLPGQGTGLHDHGGASGAFTVVAGHLHERSLTAVPGRRTAARTRVLGPGAVREFGPSYVHEVTNIGTEPAVSVHVYTPRLTAMTIFADDGDALGRPGADPLTRLRVERSGEDW